MHRAHGVGELSGRGVLDDEPARARLERAAHVSGAAERRHDNRPDRGQFRGQETRGLDAVDAGHLDIEQTHVDIGRASRRHDLVAAPDLGDDVDVRFELQQRGERPRTSA